MSKARFATLYRPDGTITQIQPENGQDFTLEEAQKLVDGYVQLLHLGGRRICLCNEDGVVRRMPHNSNASEAAGRDLVGPVVICTSSMFR